MKLAPLAGNVLRRVLLDPRTLALVLFTPLLFVLLFGYTFAPSDPGNLSLAVFMEDNGLASVRTEELGRVTLEPQVGKAFVEVLQDEGIRLVFVESREVAEQAVKDGTAQAAATLPVGFSHAAVNAALYLWGPRTMEVDGRRARLLPPDEAPGPVASFLLDDANPDIARFLAQALEQALFTAVANGHAPPTRPPVEIRRLYDGEIAMLDYTAPAIIGFAITLITLMLTSVSIVRERAAGTLTRVLIAPVRPWEIVAGYALAFTLVGLVQAGELFAVARVLFGVRFAGSAVWVGLIMLTYVLVLQGIAILISTIARNEFQALQYALLLLVPAIMVSGVFWPVEAMPEGMRFVSWLSPLTYANTALREVMLRGRGLEAIGRELGVLAGIAVVCLGVSTLALRSQGRAG